jgi:hypothetical protein
MLDQMIKLVIKKLTGKNQFHDCHLWVKVHKVELHKSSGVGEDYRTVCIERLYNTYV